jgi:hypothetical protein
MIVEYLLAVSIILLTPFKIVAYGLDALIAFPYPPSTTAACEADLLSFPVNTAEKIVVAVFPVPQKAIL